MIRFYCPNCKQKLGVPDEYAGRRIRCNKCSHPSIVPQPADKTKPGQVELQPFQQFESPQQQANDLPPLDPNLEAIREASPLRSQHSSDTADTDGKSERFSSREIVSSPHWYWPLLFPLNGTGLGMIGMFVLSRFLLRLVIFGSVYMIPIFGIVLALIVSVISFIIRVYACWYTCFCVRMSAEGQIKAPDALQHDEGGLWEMIKQMFRVAVAIGFCVLPAILYSRHYKRTDELFWGVLAVGWFFLPMTLLSTIVYDSLAGLNPFLIVISIIRVLFKYVLLVLELSIPFGLFVIAAVYSKQLGIWFILPAQAILLYLAFVGAAMLGRFFYLNEERLNWAV